MSDERDDKPGSQSANPPPLTSAGERPSTTAGPGVLTALICERCGAENLVRVKGCWYCERCHYKFDCYGW